MPTVTIQTVSYTQLDVYKRQAFSLADAWIFVQVSGLQDTYFAEALDAVKEMCIRDRDNTGSVDQ